jgi:hypothetical protein
MQTAVTRMEIARARARHQKGPAGYDHGAAGHRLRVARIALGLSETEAARSYGVTLRAREGIDCGDLFG